MVEWTDTSKNFNKIASFNSSGGRIHPRSCEIRTKDDACEGRDNEHKKTNEHWKIYCDSTLKILAEESSWGRQKIGLVGLFGSGITEAARSISNLEAGESGHCAR